MEGFYVTLPSNSSFQYFPENKVSDFITKLPRAIQLTGRWEVALSEIQYPVNWFTLKKDDGKITVWPFDEVSGIRGESVEISVGEGYYSGVNKLLQNINKRLERNLSSNIVRFEYDSLVNKIRAYTTSCLVEVSKPLREIMGYKRNLISERTELKGLYGSWPVDMRHGINCLYVYSDIVQSGIVGDAHVPLLRVVPSRGVHGDIHHISFQNQYYVPLQKRSFDTVRIYIADDAGDTVAFRGGRSVITLHFRRVPLS